MNDVRKMLEARIPGLHARIEKMLVEAEARYNDQTNQAPSEFLLQHARRTAAIAYKVALMERVDPFLPSLVALYHDAGKFHDGSYHNDDVPEEEHAAAIAEQMLSASGLQRGDIESVLEALRGLYNDGFPSNAACRVVQDADRLDKLGALGVGAFFTKAALRGRGLLGALTHALSRELTYSLAAPHSMLTETGRRLAREQSAKAIAFYDDLLQDLENWGIASFERRVIVLEEDFRARDGSSLPRLEVTIVVPRACPECDASLVLKHSRIRARGGSSAKGSAPASNAQAAAIREKHPSASRFLRAAKLTGDEIDLT
ncbi:MAG: HD domain-containing protein [Betaproteobacteria bacterium]|nr:HD domain-containing protein [Betaproteobacteria bacterium]